MRLRGWIIGLKRGLNYFVGVTITTSIRWEGGSGPCVGVDAIPNSEKDGFPHVNIVTVKAINTANITYIPRQNQSSSSFMPASYRVLAWGDKLP